MITRKMTMLALFCAAALAMGGIQLAQAGGHSTTNSGIYGETGDYHSSDQFVVDGSHSGTTGPPIEPVPEPATVTLVALGLYALHRKARVLPNR